MSTFCGLFDEIPFISVDRFESHNLSSELFFLSHCHSDHMMGLNRFIKLKGKLYCSQISAVFLKKQFPNLEDNIAILEIETPTELGSTSDENKIVVTAIPAQHCPGSIMIIFETGKTRLLYTGDFRLSKICMEKIDLLKEHKFHKVFLDSTFLHEKYSDFPTQIESINTVCKLAKDWIKNGTTYKIILEIPAQYGLEYLFMEMAKKLNTKIYVEEKQIEKYVYFPDMDQCLTNDCYDSQILVKQKNFFPYKVKNHLDEFLNNENYKFRILKPTAIYWRYWKKSDPIFLHEGKEIYRIAYSSHSSLNEIKEFLRLTKPGEVKLNVVPTNLKQKSDMEKLLEKITKNFQSTSEENNNLEEIYNFKNILEKPNFCRDISLPQLPPKRHKFSS